MTGVDVARTVQGDLVPRGRKPGLVAMTWVPPRTFTVPVESRFLCGTALMEPPRPPARGVPVAGKAADRFADATGVAKLRLNVLFAPGLLTGVAVLPAAGATCEPRSDRCCAGCD